MHKIKITQVLALTIVTIQGTTKIHPPPFKVSYPIIDSNQGTHFTLKTIQSCILEQHINGTFGFLTSLRL